MFHIKSTSFQVVLNRNEHNYINRYISRARYLGIGLAEHLHRNCINVSNRCVALYDVKMNMMSYVKITRTKFRAVFANGRHFLSALAKCAVITYR